MGEQPGRELESALRRSLTEQAARVPATRGDLSGVALARARGVQRRRTVAGLAAVVAATVIATGAWWHGLPEVPAESGYGAVSGFIGEPSPQPRSPEADSGPRPATDEGLAQKLATAVIAPAAGDAGLVLATADGGAFDLPAIREVSSAQRLDAGWALVGGAPGRQRLWWVTTGTEPVPLLAGMDAIVVDRDRVAWQRGALLSAATLSGGTLLGRVSTTGPADDARPVGFVGDAVLLRRPVPNRAADTWDVWRPGGGDYRPLWRPSVHHVYGASPDGESAIGLVPAPADPDRYCLARLETARQLQVAQTECLAEGPGADLGLDPAAAISPDGRWLLTTTASDPLLVDLNRLFADPPATALRPLTGVAQPDQSPLWLSPDRVLLSSGDRLLQLRPTQLVAEAGSTVVDQIPLTGPPPVIAAGG